MKNDHDMEEALKRLVWSAPPEVDRRVLSDAQAAFDHAARRHSLFRAVGLVALAATVLAVAAGTILFVSRRPPIHESSPEIVRSRAGQAVPQNGDLALALSLVRLNAMASDPQRLLDYLDSQSRPLRTTEAMMTPLTSLSGVRI